MTFSISRDGQSIRCNVCSLLSSNAHDVANRYCGNCHVFYRPEDEIAPIAAPLDYVAVEALSAAFLTIIREHYLSRPTDRSRVLEILNALASTTAVIIAGAGDGQREAMDFFNAAFTMQLDETNANPPVRTQ